MKSLDLLWFCNLIRLVFGAKPPPSYKYKGPRPIEGIQSIKYNTIYLFNSQTLISSNLITCCSSFVSTVTKGVLGGCLPTLEQAKVRLPRRGPSRTSVCWIFIGIPTKSEVLVSKIGSSGFRRGAERSPSACCTFSAQVFGVTCFRVNILSVDSAGEEEVYIGCNGRWRSL
jgi:hypothetical protein